MQKITFVDRVSEHPGRRKFITTDTHTVAAVYDVERDEGAVSVQGTPYSAAVMNQLQDNIEAAIGFDLTGTLTAGNTTLTLTDSSITTSSTIDIYTSVYGISPTNVTVITGSITLTFAAQAIDVDVKVVVK